MSTTLLALTTLAASFLTCKEIEGRSPMTVSWYRDILARFCRCVDDTMAGAGLPDIGLPEAREFMHYLQCGTVMICSGAKNFLAIPTAYESFSLILRLDSFSGAGQLHWAKIRVA